MGGQGILFYGRPGCIDCDEAKNVFKEEGVVYDYTDVVENPAALAELKRICAERGAEARVPLIDFPPPINRVFIEPRDEQLEELRQTLRVFKASAHPETG